MKKTILYIFSIIISLGVFAQSKNAEKIIEDITTKTQSYSSVEVEFSYTYEDPSSGEEVSEPGKLIISGDRYILEIEGQTVICDGETIWTYIKDAWEVQINSIDEDDDAITPSKLLTTYNDEYKAKLDKEFKRDGVHYQRIELKPEDGKKWVKLEVVVNADKQEISEITIYDKNGGNIHYIISKFTPEVPVSDDDFTFDPEKHPEVEVVDMR